VSPKVVAERLLEIAARRSVETQFGWAHPDCAALHEAARLLRGEPVQVDVPGAVLSADGLDVARATANLDKIHAPFFERHVDLFKSA